MSTSQPTNAIDKAQALNTLRLRALQARSGFLELGTEAYMPFIEAQVSREGGALNPDQKVRIRQVMNANLSEEDADVLALIERALETQKAA